MKKLNMLLTISILATTLVACENLDDTQYTIYSFDTKVQMIEDAKAGDKNIQKEIEANRIKLIKSISKGDEVAEQEDLEWASAYKTYNLKKAGKNFGNNLEKAFNDLTRDLKLDN